MVQRYNADLANNFGNLANRVLNMAVNYVSGVAPEPSADGPLASVARSSFAAQQDAMASLDFAGAFGAVWELIRATNAHIEERKPWALHKAGDSIATAAVLGDCLEALRIVAVLSWSVVPNAATELWRRLGMPGVPHHVRLPEAAAWGQLIPGARLEKGAPLFPRKDVE
jgi:methionyl-tRNA synthetase